MTSPKHRVERCVPQTLCGFIQSSNPAIPSPPPPPPLFSPSPRSPSLPLLLLFPPSSLSFPSPPSSLPLFLFLPSYLLLPLSSPPLFSSSSLLLLFLPPSEKPSEHHISPVTFSALTGKKKSERENKPPKLGHGVRVYITKGNRCTVFREAEQ